MPFERPIGDVEFVAVDLETTGLSPGFDRITEIGMVRFRVRSDGTVVPGPVFERLVNPGRPIPEPIARLTGIDDALVADAPRLAEVWPALDAFVEAAREDARGRVVMLAHNAQFDLSFLVAGAARVGCSWAGPTTLCTMRIARKVLPGAPRYRLGTLVDWLGCARPGAVHHRALEDALDARNLFAECVRIAVAPTLLGLGGAAALEPIDLADLVPKIPVRLAGLERCILEGQTVHLVYRGGSKGRQRRPITPLVFYRRQGVLYLRAWCQLDDLAKSFRCDRIVDIEVKPESSIA